jgi:regulator of protease activity HflC (stomatin/prohibitin superfamily)
MRKKTGSVVSITILAVLLVLLSLAYVPVGHTGVVKTFGAPNGKILENGLHFKAPLAQSVANVNNKTQALPVDASAVSKDLQEVSSTVVVNFKISASESVNVVRNIGANVLIDTILAPAVQESVKAVTAQYTAEGLITERAKVGSEISALLEAKVTEYGIIVQEFNITNFDFSEAFNQAIEAKQVAQQDLIRVKTEQEELVVKAEAAAKAAEANARAVLIDAEAQAEANIKISASLTANLVEYQKIQKWNGVLPQVSGSEAIVDFRNTNP